jgi:hypothetical protein
VASATILAAFISACCVDENGSAALARDAEQSCAVAAATCFVFCYVNNNR